MRPFSYERAPDANAAVKAGSADGAMFLAGGTTLADLMRLEVLRPRALVDLGGLALTAIEDTADGGLKIGALVTNDAVAYDPRVVERYPVLHQAILAGASPQIRNMATTGGNLLQRTRCPYFRDPQVAHCNRRVPGSGCAAIGGVTRSHAILGTSPHCIATHPSDMAVGLLALDALVHIHGARGPRTLPLDDLHLVPGNHPEIETGLQPGELITHVELPATRFAKHSHYVKVRDRASFAFALASAAVAVELAEGSIAEARIALGGVATKPWRADKVEAILVGKRPSLDLFVQAASAAVDGAKPQDGNRFKVELVQRTLIRALDEVMA